MKTKKLPIWVWIVILAATCYFFVTWIIPNLVTWIMLWLKSIGVHGFFYYFIDLTLRTLLAVETYGRYLMFVWSQSPRFEQKKTMDWRQLNLDSFTIYTYDLKKLGFIFLGDYTATNFRGTLRLFSNPELACFAEVAQLKGQHIFCTISCELESDWAMVVTNCEITSEERASTYAFKRLPRKMIRWTPKAPAEVLLMMFLDWRSQVTQDLSIQPLQNTSLEMYFAQRHKWDRKMLRKMWFTSVTWRILEYASYGFKPQTDWLGDYPKVKARLVKAAINLSS
jgi:hypothetical protein